MKLKKTMKQLKFWSKNKKKNNKDFHYYYKLAHDQYSIPPQSYTPSPPPQRPAPMAPVLVSECHLYEPIEPSAPPLPPWLESQKSWYETSSSTDLSDYNPFDDIQMLSQAGSSEDHCTRTTNDVDVKPTSFLEEHPKMPGGIDHSSSSYQQHMDQDSEHSILTVPRRKQVAAVRLLGCVVNFGDLLFRCFFPCFHVPEHRSFRSSDGSHKALLHDTREKEM